MRSMVILRLCAPVLCACLSTACLIEQIEPNVRPDAPVQLHAASQGVVGLRLDDILSRAERTLLPEAGGVHLIRDVARSAKPSVVSLYALTRTPVRVRLLPIKIPGGGIRVTLKGQALGTGFFIHSSGLLLTNHHVISTATQLHGLTSDGFDFEVIVLASDPVYDLALCKAVAGDRSFKALPMGNSDEIEAGEPTIAVGNPLGLGHTVTFGIVSSTDRHLQGVDPEEGREIDYIQMDTAINPGSSGGPLITLAGAWIGVNTAGITEAQNVGFAVPSSQVTEFLRQVLAGQGEKFGP